MITIEDIESILGTWHSSADITAREVAGLTSQDESLVSKIIDMHDKDATDEQILEEINKEKPIDKVKNKLKEGVEKTKEVAKKGVNKLKEKIDKDITEKELRDIALRIERSNATQDQRENTDYIIGFASKNPGVNLTNAQSIVVMSYINPIQSSIEEKIKEEEKAIESLKKTEMKDKDQYVKINDLDNFAAQEFINLGKPIKTEKAVRGFRDKKGDKVIIYYNTKELYEFLNDYGIHYTLFESTDELHNYLRQFIPEGKYKKL